MMIVLVGVEMLGKLIDVRGQQRNLDFRGTGIGRAALEILNDLALDFCTQWHGC